MDRAIQRLFLTQFPAFSGATKLPHRVHNAARQLMRCRTPAMGGFYRVCPEHDEQQVVFYSCKHRCCPQCNARARSLWLDAHSDLLLPCAHHHVIFTIPHEFIPLWQYNRRAFTSLLFGSVHDTLLPLLQSQNCLGATPGIMAAFHSWGRSLSVHPHVHCLITDGGLSGDGRWCSSRRSHFVSVRLLMSLFRSLFCARLHRWLRESTPHLASYPADKWHAVIARSQRKKWNVHLRERYSHGHGVMAYLARYVRGGPLHSSQLQFVAKGQLQFRYRAHHDNGEREHVLAQSATGFMARFIEHIPERYQQLFRFYGLYANTKRAALARARQCLPSVANAPTIKTRQITVAPSIPCCSQCQRPLQRSAPLPRLRGPPV